MSDHDASRASTTGGLPVSPSLGPALEQAAIPPQAAVVDARMVYTSVLAIALGAAAAITAALLIVLIDFITNLAFFGRWSIEPASPADHHLGLLVILIPIIGGLIVGVMARFGSRAIRGHGIPEAMEHVLTKQSRIPARMTWLKPLSAAVSIGTGGPFGAEGPIIATGGALGSFIGQVLSVTAVERKILLAAGAAAGMAAIFGSPVAAVLLAIELLLFEFRARSIIPVALASATAASIHALTAGFDPFFEMPDLLPPGGAALAIYALIGAVLGVASVGVTRVVYLIEDGFARLPIHWMWWPAIGAIIVGVVGYFAPRTLGVGYENISDILSGAITWQVIAVLCAMKFISWSFALGSGTSGGTLAPMLTIGGALGMLLGVAAGVVAPWAGVDPRLAALVGMAALFAGASRAMFTSVVFAFEATMQPLGLLPLLAACAASYLASSLLMRNTIMTEKISRRGVNVPAEYAADIMERITVRSVATKKVATLRAQMPIEDVRAWLRSGAPETSHRGFPIVDERGILAGMLTRRDLLEETKSHGSNADDTTGITVGHLIRRPPVLVYADCNLREAVGHMVRHRVGRLPVVERGELGLVVGIITRADILRAYGQELDETHRVHSD